MSNRPERLVSVALDRLHQLQMDNLTLTTQRDALLEALKLAVRQNEHDMVMTGEECRQCRAAIKAVEEGK